MRFLELARLYEKLERTSSYNAMRDILSGFFKKTPKAELEFVAYLTLGQIASQFADVNLGMADKMVVRSIALAGKEKEAIVLQKYKKLGDVGRTAEQYSGRGKLSVKTVFETLHKIAQSSGSGSQDRKIKLLASLLSAASSVEARYLARIVLGDLRLGVGDKTVLDALAIAYTGTKETRKDLEHAYNVCPDVGIIARTIAHKGLRGVRQIGVEVGVPIQSMLCQRIKDIEEVKNKMGYPVVVEEKYDGERIQVHKLGNNVKLYSRRLENITSQFPDIVDAVKKAVKAKNCVIDSEVMPVDKKGNLLSFQTLMQRRRKYDIEEYIRKVPVALFSFDLLFLNGKSLIREQYRKRYALLQKNIRETGKIKLALRKICSDADCIEDLFNKVVEFGGEGVVIKNLNGSYEAGVRGWNWIKWKPEYVKGLRDTFDVVVVGAYYGKGRRAGTYGALLCAVYNDKKDRFETFCKLGSGFTDKTLAELPKRFKKIDHKPARLEVSRTMTPDVWFDPRIVVEVTGAEITKSPNHTLGYALRFPRFLRWREKKPEQSTTAKEVLKMV
ncbi:MAG TPA: ATP-dependent DNA ligase [Candidatus Nanoarchaeia archaeon]|nr:ATP-dependent DNA ligase [Candidatus Nanoarchaeia archaeon]